MGKGSERSWSGGSERYSRNPWSPSPFPFFQSFFPWARKGIRNELDSIRPRHPSRPSRLDQLIAFVEFRVPSQKTESQMSPLRRRLASTACLPRSTDHQPQPQSQPEPSSQSCLSSSGRRSRHDLLNPSFLPPLSRSDGVLCPMPTLIFRRKSSPAPSISTHGPTHPDSCFCVLSSLPLCRLPNLPSSNFLLHPPLHRPQSLTWTRHPHHQHQRHLLQRFPPLLSKPLPSFKANLALNVLPNLNPPPPPLLSRSFALPLTRLNNQ
jgi:hypothetical protein